MECPNCEGMMHYDGVFWECFECGETIEEDYDPLDDYDYDLLDMIQSDKGEGKWTSN